MRWIMLYSCCIENGQLCMVGRQRCEASLKLAQDLPEAIFVLGVGLESYCRRQGVKEVNGSLTKVMTRYLIRREVPPRKILSNALGYESVTETAAVIECIERRLGRRIERDEVYAVTSILHKWRVYLIWRFLGRRIGWKNIRTIQGDTSFRKFLKEIIAIPVSLGMALGIRGRI